MREGMHIQDLVQGWWNGFREVAHPRERQDKGRCCEHATRLAQCRWYTCAHGKQVCYQASMCNMRLRCPCTSIGLLASYPAFIDPGAHA